jgi:hypothetical protein
MKPGVAQVKRGSNGGSVLGVSFFVEGDGAGCRCVVSK